MATEKIIVPDIGDYNDIPVIEILVNVGDSIATEQGICTLESDKATMEIPSPKSGVVKKWLVKLGDSVSQGTAIIELEVSDEPSATMPQVAPAASKPPPAANLAPAITPPVSAPPPSTGQSANKFAHAGPSVRKLARELGVDLAKVLGTGTKGRISRDDVNVFVKKALTSPSTMGADNSSVAGLNLLAWPKVDFAKFGEVEVKPLSRIKKISGANLHRNWVMIPHVTQHDEAEVSSLEVLRKSLQKEAEKAGVKVTILVFLIKAVVAALKKFPDFNASLEGDNLVLKKYFHIGVAVDTPNGLMVPVLRDCDQKGVFQLSKELSTLSATAREGKLKPTDMQGGCFSISSLGGLGGHYFTPIINAPEVAILGVSRSRKNYIPNDNNGFKEQLMLPLSLSYDHRVIDGASAARFISYLSWVLSDLRRALL